MATHRAMALKDFDEIIFMDEGTIIERGTFADLMELNGHYAARTISLIKKFAISSV